VGVHFDRYSGLALMLEKFVFVSRADPPPGGIVIRFLFSVICNHRDIFGPNAVVWINNFQNRFCSPMAGSTNRTVAPCSHFPSNREPSEKAFTHCSFFPGSSMVFQTWALLALILIEYSNFIIWTRHELTLRPAGEGRFLARILLRPVVRRHPRRSELTPLF
jgi:hypothetical protein